MSQTHFYALLSMVAGAAIGRRPEKHLIKKTPYIIYVVQVFVESVQVIIIGLLRCENKWFLLVDLLAFFAVLSLTLLLFLLN